MEQEPSTHPPSPIPDSHFAAMGRVANSWANFEYAVDDTIWRLLGTEQARGGCLTYQFNSIHQRFRALIALVAFHDISEDFVAALKRFSGQLSGIIDKRNRTTHDIETV
jgi:hypothetical protein